MNNDSSTKTLNWDLSEGNHVNQVGWPSDHPTDTLHYSDVMVTIKLPHGYEIRDWQASNVYVRSRDGQQIRSVIVRTRKMTLDEAYSEAQGLAQQFGLAQTSIESWYEQTRAQPSPMHTNFLATNSFTTDDDEEIAVTLESANSFNDEEPWIISLNLTWLSAP